jgi:carbon monoxide dehydrogenase subunit G
MTMEHEVYVPVPAAVVRGAFADPGRVARCVPGLRLDPDADPAAPSGRLRLRVGPLTITYRGTCSLSAAGDGVTVRAEGAEARGDGRITAELTVVPRAAADGSGATLSFSGSATGRGRIADVDPPRREAAARRLLDRFAENLAEELAAPAPPVAGGIGEPDDNERAIPGIPAAPEPEPEPETGAGAQAAPAAGPEAGGPLLDDPDGVDGVDDIAGGLLPGAASGVPGAGEDALAGALGGPGVGRAGPEPEADVARRTMIGRSAEEVDHAPPRGRYAPEPAPGRGAQPWRLGGAPATAGTTLRWAAPAAALAVASAVVLGRALRRRYGGR